MIESTKLDKKENERYANCNYESPTIGLGHNGTGHPILRALSGAGQIVQPHWEFAIMPRPIT